MDRKAARDSAGQCHHVVASFRRGGCGGAAIRALVVAGGVPCLAVAQHDFGHVNWIGDAAREQLGGVDRVWRDASGADRRCAAAPPLWRSYRTDPHARCRGSDRAWNIDPRAGVGFDRASRDDGAARLSDRAGAGQHGDLGAGRRAWHSDCRALCDDWRAAALPGAVARRDDPRFVRLYRARLWPWSCADHVRVDQRTRAGL